MAKTIEEKAESFSNNYSNLVGEGISSVGVNAGRNFFSRENLQAVRYSAILDKRVCAYCRSLDGKVISFDNPSYVSGDYDPPQHSSCRCVWVYISKKEKDVEFTWEDPPPELREKHANWNQEPSAEMKKLTWEISKQIKAVAKADLEEVKVPITKPPPKVSERLWENLPEYTKLLEIAKQKVQGQIPAEFLSDLDKISNWSKAKEAQYSKLLQKLDLENTIAKSLGWKKGVDYWDRTKIEKPWLDSSSDARETKLLHVALNRLNGRPDFLGIEPFKKIDPFLESFVKNNPKILKIYQNSLLLRRSASQAIFDSAGITHLEIYRGTTDRKGILGKLLKGESATVKLRPLSSWSMDLNSAGGFGEVLIQRTDVRNIWFSVHSSAEVLKVGEMELVLGESEKSLNMIAKPTSFPANQNNKYKRKAFEIIKKEK